jgi:hypothetical protein
MENQELKNTIQELFGKIESVKKIYLLENSIVTIFSNPERIDRCKLFDAEQNLSKKYPDKKFVFYSSEGEANYLNYEVMYEKN